jgi:ligand-binding sensor domain-containing protein
MHKWLSFLVCLFYLGNAVAQTLPFKTFSSKDGLINGQVTALVRDDRGLLWVGTQFGVNRFDSNASMNLS